VLCTEVIFALNNEKNKTLECSMKIKFVTTLLACCLVMTVWAATVSPGEMIQSTTNQVLAALNAKKATLKEQPQVVESIMQQYLLPHIALDNMARAVLGRTAWNAATPVQKTQFTEAFKHLLLNTYSAALASYTDQKVQFLPVRGNAEATTRAQIDSKIIRQDGPPINVSYQLIFEQGEWKVYDFSVDGISMLGSFRSQFSNVLSQKGLDALIQRLSEHNAQF
jgi:phospholipid transport system substrate-binding protein